MDTDSQNVSNRQPLQERQPKVHPFLPRALQSPTFLTWLRRSHGWLGMWGAVAGILFGLTTITMVHGDVFRSGESMQSIVQLPVDGTVIASTDELGAFVKAELGLTTQWQAARNPQRGGGAAPVEMGAVGRMDASGRVTGSGRAGSDARIRQPSYTTQFTSPGRTLDLSYVLGNKYIEIIRTERGFLETLNRLHRGNGAQLGWTLLGDAFSGALIVLVITGVLLWSKMDGSRLLAIGLGSLGLLSALYFGLVGA